MEIRKETCLCCGHIKKTWKKCINSTAAASLCKLVKMYKGKPLHLDAFTVLAKDRNFSQLALWGLIEPAFNKDSTKRASGMWSPTKHGIEFVMGREKEFKYVVTEDNVLLEYQGPVLSIRDALGERFNYNQLMMDNISTGRE